MEELEDARERDRDVRLPNSTFDRALPWRAPAEEAREEEEDVDEPSSALIRSTSNAAIRSSVNPLLPPTPPSEGTAVLPSAPVATPAGRDETFPAAWKISLRFSSYASCLSSMVFPLLEEPSSLPASEPARDPGRPLAARGSRRMILKAGFDAVGWGGTRSVTRRKELWEMGR